MSDPLTNLKRHKLRVALVAPSTQFVGGQGVQAAELRRNWWADPDVDLEFVSIRPHLPRWLSWTEAIKGVRTLARMPFYLMELWRAAGRAEVLHVFSASYWSFLLAPVPAMLIAHLRGKKVVLDYRSGEARDHLENWRTALFFLRRADRLAVESSFLSGVMQEFGLDATVVSSLINFERFQFRTRRPLHPHLISTRAFEPYYGVDVVLRAFAEIQLHVPEATLTLLGSGSLEASLRSLACRLGLRNVAWLGAVSHDQVAQHLDEACILLNGSRLDSVPNAILEAMTSGLPVVSTAPAGINYVIEHGRTGLLCPVDDWRAMAANTLQLLANPAFANGLAAAAFEATACRRWPAVREAWLRLYREALGAGDTLTTEDPQETAVGDSAGRNEQVTGIAR